MVEIERVLRAHGLPFTTARLNGHRCKPFDAYRAESIGQPVPRGHDVCFVECEVFGLTPAKVIDHHRESDPGYGLPPERYLEGSSLGQLLTHLGMQPTEEQRIICAADHCLAHAYRGLCPGVDPEALGRWRAASRARARGISDEELLAQIEQARRVLRDAPRIRLAGVEVAWLDEPPAEAPEASARDGIPLVYVKREADGRRKAGILGAPAPAVAAFIEQCGLRDVYGDPERGFAGGYL
jgi:hypothetical protein